MGDPGIADDAPGGGRRALFSDRADAGRRLAGRLGHLRSPEAVVVGLPRGGVIVASEVARALDAPLDVLLVRKLGVPFRPELAMGAVGEQGFRWINQAVVRAAGITPAELSQVEEQESAALDRLTRRLRAGRPALPLRGRVVIIVDDGVATGATARVACLLARARGAARVVLAVPVAPRECRRRFEDVVDELVSLTTPARFGSIGAHFADFTQAGDEDVLTCLERARRRTADRSPAPSAPVPAPQQASTPDPSTPDRPGPDQPGPGSRP